MDKITNLLNQVSIISSKNAEILDAVGGRFNMFRVCGVDHYENTHSAIIAELLNTNGTHGLKSQLLECFIEILGNDFSVQGFNCENAVVCREHSTEYGRIDILIKDKHRQKAIIIENKVYSNDQWQQLKRYNQYAEGEYGKGNYQILYLTLWGNDASEQSGSGVPYLTISYKETIINWLEKCVAIASRFPIVRETIVQYINHLKELTNQDMDNRNKEEITEVLSRVGNLKAAQIIHRNYSATLDAIVKKHFNPKMEEFAKQKGLEYHYEEIREECVKFYFTNPLWQGKCCIEFTFESGPYFYGLSNDLQIYNLSAEKRKGLHEQLKKLGIHPCEENKKWPFYQYIDNLTIDNWENDIINSDKFLSDCKKKTESILKAMEEIEL